MVQFGRQGNDLRIGDPEREGAMSLLGEHLTAGRLDVHEYDARCAKIAAARVQSDIVPVFSDLPSPRPISVAPPTRRTTTGSGVLVVCSVTAVVLFAVVAKQLWLLALLALAGVLLFTRRRR